MDVLTAFGAKTPRQLQVSQLASQPDRQTESQPDRQTVLPFLQMLIHPPNPAQIDNANIFSPPYLTA